MERKGISAWELDELRAVMAALDHEMGADYDESDASPVRLTQLGDRYVQLEYDNRQRVEEQDGGKSSATLYRKQVPLSLLTDHRFAIKDRIRFSGDWQTVEHETKVSKKVAGKKGEPRWLTTIERWREPTGADDTKQTEHVEQTAEIDG